jgi:polyisoprenoid-binding protein YceI
VAYRLGTAGQHLGVRDVAGSKRRGARRWVLWLAGAAAAVVVLAVGGTFLYIHVISGPTPAPLSLKQVSHGTGGPSPASESAATSVAGTWHTTSGSVVGYRVKEVLLGQNHTAVGRTSDIAGHMTISGSTVTAATFTVQMATIKSDESERDVQFRGRIMDTAAYPTGTLTLTEPIPLGALPAAGVVRTYTATADLTLHGQTHPVTFPLEAERTAGAIEVSGSIPILFAHWGIPNPSFTGFVTTQNHGVLEFLVRFTRS